MRDASYDFIPFLKINDINKWEKRVIPKGISARKEIFKTSAARSVRRFLNNASSRKKTHMYDRVTRGQKSPKGAA